MLAAILAALPAGGTVGLVVETPRAPAGCILWPMFGATNQLLGGLAFLVVAFWLWRRQAAGLVHHPAPMIFMLIMPAWAMIWQLFVANAGDAPGWIRQENPNWILVVVAVATLALEIWMIVEAVLLWPKVRGRVEAALPPNVAAVIETGGGKPSDIVRMTWYVTDVNAYRASTREIGEIYRAIIGNHYPAMTLVNVVALVEARAKVEIEATAMLP